MNGQPETSELASPQVPKAGGSLDDIVRRISFAEMDWPAGSFRVLDDGDPHGKLWIVAPGGQMIDVGCHADPEIDVARAQWMCDTLNAARERKAESLIAEWESEENKWKAESTSLKDYDWRMRARAYANVYERCRKQLGDILANISVSGPCPPAGSANKNQLSGG